MLDVKARSGYRASIESSLPLYDVDLDLLAFVAQRAGVAHDDGARSRRVYMVDELAAELDLRQGVTPDARAVIARGAIERLAAAEFVESGQFGADQLDHRGPAIKVVRPPGDWAAVAIDVDPFRAADIAFAAREARARAPAYPVGAMSQGERHAALWDLILDTGESDALLQDSVGDQYAEHVLSTQRGIFHRDLNDCRRCDAILVNFIGAERVSIGSVMELGIGAALNKPIILAINPSNPSGAAAADAEASRLEAKAAAILDELDAWIEQHAS